MEGKEPMISFNLGDLQCSKMEPNYKTHFALTLLQVSICNIKAYTPITMLLQQSLPSKFQLKVKI